MVSKGVRIWIAVLCAMVFSMVVVGGVTRLTRSGLSIVEWQPIKGVVPPLNEAEWQAAFDAYRQFPEYQHVNRGMAIGEFKQIFFWEYLHRLLGRVAGLVLGIPLVVMLMRRRLSKQLAKRLAIAFLLGGLQGLVGWYMVKSGLVNVPRVSHYRLATHLSLAFFLFAFLFWTYLGLRPRRETSSVQVPSRGFGRAAIGLTALIAVQIVYGALVAGLRAGYAFNTFPLMNGQIVPEGVLALTPGWINLLENPVTVQFVHRMIAWTILATVGLFWWRARSIEGARPLRRAANVLMGAVVVQFILGVVTLLAVVPVALGVLHQVGAFLLLAAAVHACYVTMGASSEIHAQSRLDTVSHAGIAG